MSGEQIWTLDPAPGPLIATAIHAGHDLRPEVAGIIALSEAERLREEDPRTEQWASAGNSRIVVLRSRFEVDINRPRDKAIYLAPEDAWGLNTYSTPPPRDVIERSLAEYDAFYAMLRRLIEQRLERQPRVVVFDLHSYNHRRSGPAAAPDDPRLNPEINVGTGTMDRQRWSAIVELFLEQTRQHRVNGKPLDVRENVKFKGGQMVRWLHQTFPEQVCAIAIEVKKIYMDEWTGSIDQKISDQLEQVLQAAAAAVVEHIVRS